MNEAVINGLNVAENTTNIYAYLVDDLGKSVYTFLFNPEEKSFSRQARYAEGGTALTSIQSQFYVNTTGLTLSLSNLLLESYSRGKSCKLLLDRLQDLMVADPTKGQYNPSTVYFKWGNDTFGPAVVTELNWVETSWLGGSVASARVNLTLLQVPSKIITPDPPNTSSTANTLTERQKEDAISKARTWLSTNVKKLPESVSALVRVNTYRLKVSNDGIVSIFDKKERELGVVGNYKDGKLDTSKGNLIKK